MIEPETHHKGGIMRAGHYVVVGAVAVVAVLIAFAVLSFVAGLLFAVVKIALIVAVVAVAFWFVRRVAHRSP